VVFPLSRGASRRRNPARLLLDCFVGALVAVAISGAHADDYPTHAIRFVVAFTPGGPSDLLTRTIAQKLSERVGQPVLTDNRPGAGGNLAADLVAKASPDGYTLLTANIGILAANASLYGHLSFDPIEDFAPIILVGAQPNILVVHPSLPVHSVAELIALAKAQPGRLDYASSGNGTPSHLSAELFKAMTGVDMVHIAYRGGVPALADLIAGQGVQLMFATAVSALPFIRAGQLRALAVTTATRSPLMPDLPTLQEAGLTGFESTAWHGVVAPAGAPPAIIDRLNREIGAILTLPDVRKVLSTEGIDIIGGTPAQFAAYIRAEIPKWAEIVRISGAHVD
jgi:tripartite-type tricarboxylate transporter receptor subunit TctC